MRQLLNSLNLHTVCQEARCPNISECFQAGVATFLILGAVCTRQCQFCAIEKGVPQPPDPQEPLSVADAVRQLTLRHVVVTSVTRDDLPDGGSSHFSSVIQAIHAHDAQVAVEVLVPDFQGDELALQRVLDARPQVFAHNVETVPRLYPVLRQGAQYERSLRVLAAAHCYRNDIPVKSGLMLGAGEQAEEVRQVIRDLRQAGCEFLSIGQYLAPSKRHAPVHEFIAPEQFAQLREYALAQGFRYVESGPYVRSSYLASHYLAEQHA